MDLKPKISLAVLPAGPVEMTQQPTSYKTSSDVVSVKAKAKALVHPNVLMDRYFMMRM
jgi:hypothetical protein